MPIHNNLMPQEWPSEEEIKKSHEENNRYIFECELAEMNRWCYYSRQRMLKTIDDIIHKELLRRIRE